MIINAAIVEDDDADAKALTEMLAAYSARGGRAEFRVTRFCDAISFLDGVRPDFDIVFMDIELPDFDGLKAAAKLRELNPSVMLMFVTNMAQFAVKGYEVDAFDFIVKPLSYGNLSLKLDRATARLGKDTSHKVSIYTPNGARIVPASDIEYVEVMNHRIVWHTKCGEFSLSGSLKKIEAELPSTDFVRINSCYIVNLGYVTSVKPQSLVCAGDELAISQPRRRDVLRAMAAYLEGGRR